MSPRTFILAAAVCGATPPVAVRAAVRHPSAGTPAAGDRSAGASHSTATVGHLAQAVPDYAGTWVLDPSRSSILSKPMRRLEIQQTGAALRTTTYWTDGTSTATRYAAGTTTNATRPDGSLVETSAQILGDMLMVRTTLTPASADAAGWTSTRMYTLAPDRSTLTITTTLARPLQPTVTQVEVYTNGAAAEVATARPAPESAAPRPAATSPRAPARTAALAGHPCTRLARAVVSMPPEDDGQKLWDVAIECEHLGDKQAALAKYQELVAYEQSLGARANQRLLGDATNRAKLMGFLVTPDGPPPAGALPLGRYTHTDLGPTTKHDGMDPRYAGEHIQSTQRYLDLRTGGRYTVETMTGRYTQQGSTLTFSSGAFVGGTATAKCSHGMLELTVFLAGNAPTVIYGYSGTGVCPP